MTNEPTKADEMTPNNNLTVERSEFETGAQAMARLVLEPHLRHAVSSSSFAGSVLGRDIEHPGLADYVDHLQALTSKADEGDVSLASQLLAAQAVTLDSMFTELARRSALNMGEYPQAAERYGRLALKAQANSRATLEALIRLHQPREQIVKHVHVNDGGQAVVADQFHHHDGGSENGQTSKQSHATEEPRQCAALPGKNAAGDAVPGTSGQGAQTVQDARRD